VSWDVYFKLAIVDKIKTRMTNEYFGQVMIRKIF